MSNLTKSLRRLNQRMGGEVKKSVSVHESMNMMYRNGFMEGYEAMKSVMEKRRIRDEDLQGVGAAIVQKKLGSSPTKNDYNDGFEAGVDAAIDGITPKDVDRFLRTGHVF